MLAAFASLLATTVTGCRFSNDSGDGSRNTPAISAPTAGAGNGAPSISGQPPTAALVNVHYEFTPSASDPNGDTLRFDIVGRPAWAAFDTQTGRLSGTPSASSTGKFENIQITVSDGTARSALPAFTIIVSEAGGLGSATLRWVAPTQTSTGEPLIDLAGFRVYYGQSSASLDRIVTIADPYATQTVIGNLGAGTWFFAVTAFTKTGTESSRSNVVSKGF